MNELKNRPLWLLWQKQTRSGGTAKVPFSAKGGSSGTTDTYRNTWVTFSEAEQASKKKAAGIGFKIPNGVFFLDIDHKTIDDPMVRELLSKFHSYTEYSVSGEGIHIYGLCDFSKLPTFQDPKDNRIKLSAEYYTHHPSNGLELYVGELTNRFAAYTGNVILNVPLKDCTDAVIDMLNRYMRKEKPSKPTKADKQIDKIIKELRSQTVMSWSAGKSEKCCLTCENWCGSRSVNYAKRAETDSPSTRGKCSVGMPADASQGPTAMAGRQCSKHKTWSRM